MLLLQGYVLEIFNNKCMPGALSVQCIAHLEQDISKAPPYLNAEIGGFEYIADPASVTFKVQDIILGEPGRKNQKEWMRL